MFIKTTFQTLYFHYTSSLQIETSLNVMYIILCMFSLPTDALKIVVL